MITRDRARRLKAKNQLYDILDQHSCVWPGCGIDDPQMLCFDRIELDAKKEEAIFRKRHDGNRNWYEYYIKHPEDARRRLQVLCYNHNRKKEMMTLYG